MIEETVGNYQLCAWKPDRYTVWVQTTKPKFAAKLAQRSDCHLAAWSVHGGYLRTFVFEGKSLAWAKRLVARYNRVPARIQDAPFGLPEGNKPESVSGEGQENTPIPESAIQPTNNQPVEP